MEIAKHLREMEDLFMIDEMKKYLIRQTHSLNNDSFGKAIL